MKMIERIAIGPRIHFGKPCVAGTRITVRSVLELVAEGVFFDAIIRDYYPDLTVEDIHACLQYAIAPAASGGIRLKSVAILGPCSTWTFTLPLRISSPVSDTMRVFCLANPGLKAGAKRGAR